MRNTIRIHPNDNVCVALHDLHAGDAAENLVLDRDIPKGHKIALRTIHEGEHIIKYGQIIGRATAEIHAGEHVHSHNMRTNLEGILEYHYNPVPQNDVHCESPYKLTGFRRKNGTVGIRNELWVIVTVGCINSLAKRIVRNFRDSHDLSDIDGIFTFEHPYGCSQMGDDHNATVAILRDIVTHPNAGGVLLLGLGCENNQLHTFYEGLSNFDKDRIRYFNCQEVDDEVEEAGKALEELYANMKNDHREPIEWSDLTFGLKCGGSDGLSGITANPLLGRFSDRVLSYGGNIILTEVPEMFGAEHLLMNRARNEDVFNQIVKLIDDYKQYFIDNHQVVYENPSPGNKAGGITTLEDKSCGCIQKGGTAIIDGTIQYGEKRTVPGLNLLYGPGNDLVSTTVLGAAGSQMVLFTTGRGTPFGGFIPTCKVSTNSDIYNKKPHWIDFNAGILTEDTTMDEAADLFIKQIVDYVNGDRKTNNETHEYKEIAIFKRGVTL